MIAEVDEFSDRACLLAQPNPTYYLTRAEAEKALLCYMEHQVFSNSQFYVVETIAVIDFNRAPNEQRVFSLKELQRSPTEHHIEKDLDYVRSEMQLLVDKPGSRIMGGSRYTPQEFVDRLFDFLRESQHSPTEPEVSE